MTPLINSEYTIKVRVRDDGWVIASIWNTDGSDVDWDTSKAICDALEKQYEKKMFIYVGKSTSTAGLYKIGVSGSPNRRAKRLKIEDVTGWLCATRLVWRLEATLHDYFAPFNVGGEWFYFPPEGDYQPFAADVTADSWLMDVASERELIEAFDSIYASKGVYNWKEDLKRRKRQITSLWNPPKSKASKRKKLE